MDNVPFHKYREVQQAFEDIGLICFCHRIVHILVLHNGYLDTPKAMSDEIALQNHWTSVGHINHNVQTITTNVVRGWIKEDNRTLVELVAGSNLENLIHDVPFFVKQSSKVREIVNMGAISWRISQHVMNGWRLKLNQFFLYWLGSWFKWNGYHLFLKWFCDIMKPS